MSYYRQLSLTATGSLALSINKHLQTTEEPPGRASAAAPVFVEVTRPAFREHLSDDSTFSDTDELLTVELSSSSPVSSPEPP